MNKKLPDKQKFAQTLQILSRISYWIHLILGAISGVTLLLVIMSRNATSSSTWFGTSIGMFSLLTLGLGVYWAYRYRQSAKKLQRIDPTTQPSRTEIIELLRISIITSLVGIFLAFIALEISLVSLVTDAIARPQGVAIYEREHIITAADILFVLAQLNILGAHFFGAVYSLGLLSWISKKEV